MPKKPKTLAMKTLEGKRIPYDVYYYPDTMRDAEEIAAHLEVSPDVVLKTLVVPAAEKGKKHLLVMIPANKQLDLKKLAFATGTKKLKMATHREAESLTGLEVGGISAIALLNKGFAIYIDENARTLSHVFVSAGQRGSQLSIALADLVGVTNARWVEATEAADKALGTE